ncbi:hypothetical protein CRENBAI_017184 [Crenichthys baileyi]|uniref:Uncharacterized protein n=1 Tax=Crenichthys baileyi TaxID=28760 RepID=A0AAV9RJ63_9TELE
MAGRIAPAPLCPQSWLHLHQNCEKRQKLQHREAESEHSVIRGIGGVVDLLLYLLSTRAVCTLGILNRGVDIVSSSLHPNRISQIWSRFGRAAVDLFAMGKRAAPLILRLLDGVREEQ